MLFGHFTSLRLANFPIVDHVDFVTNENHLDIVISKLLKTLQPHFNVLEGSRIRYIKSENNSLRLFIERLS